ncbi:MAG TPA: hypothetical protein VNQ34_06650 [Xanthobacteraceae bacterium]|jgi:hypothetical protein|nr:hypothetical protein [Xanthobacteraceae bacterium]
MNHLADQHAPVRRIFLLSLAGVFGAALATAAVFWANYGTAVFFEMIRAGIASCFG